MCVSGGGVVGGDTVCVGGGYCQVIAQVVVLDATSGSKLTSHA